MQEDFEKKIAELRDKLSNERDNAVDKERERTQQKLHEQYERLEAQFQEERRRWKDNVFHESSKVESLLKSENERLKEDIK